MKVGILSLLILFFTSCERVNFNNESKVKEMADQILEIDLDYNSQDTCHTRQLSRIFGSNEKYMNQLKTALQAKGIKKVVFSPTLNQGEVKCKTASITKKFTFENWGTLQYLCDPSTYEDSDKVLSPTKMEILDSTLTISMEIVNELTTNQNYILQLATSPAKLKRRDLLRRDDNGEVIEVDSIDLELFDYKYSRYLKHNKETKYSFMRCGDLYSASDFFFDLNNL